MSAYLLWLIVPVFIVIIVAVRDIFFQKKHTIQHNFPVVGHFRYMLESIGPELRQYLVSSNREELPFNRIERGWIYASSKNENNYEGFGTDRDIYAHQYHFVKNDMLPLKLPENHVNREDDSFIPSPKVIGLSHRRKKPYRPASIINISAMSFGSLSAKAVDSLNKGAKKANSYHNTGEGGISPYHKNGADVIFHIGTGYFGVRDEEGNFSMEKMIQTVKENPCIKAIEVKLSQGAKPGKGGVLPGKKITKEISEIRGVPIGEDVLSPSYHSAFSSVPEMVDFIEAIAENTGLPVGIKAAVGKLEQWQELAKIMESEKRGPDFIAIDGGEGGTGAAPPSFADYVSLPFVYGFAEIYKIFQSHQLTEQITFIGSGRLGFPAKAVMAFSMGVDIINVAREAMMSIGCIQAQICHTNHCPAGIATQSKWLQNGIDVTLKSERAYQYFKTFKKELLQITHAAGYEHPCQFTMEDVNVNLGDETMSRTLSHAYKYQKDPVAFSSMNELKTCEYLGGDS